MKKIITVLALTGLLFGGSLAMASKARMQALGQSSNGSLYIGDARNMFLNPGQLSMYSNSVNLEFGTTTRAGTTFAEGGFARNFGGFDLAVQLGRQTNVETAVGVLGSSGFNNVAPFNTAGTSFAAPNNAVEVIGAFKSGSNNIGVSVLFANTEIKPTGGGFPIQDSGAITVRGGVVNDGGWEAYAYIDAINEANTETAASTNNEYKGGFVGGLGGSYKTSDTGKVYLMLDNSTVEAKDATPTVDFEVSTMTVDLGHAMVHDMDGATVFYSAGVRFVSGETKEKQADTTTKNNQTFIPLVVGVEAQAMDWLKLRGSVTQNVILDTRETATLDNSTHAANTTTVAAGASFVLGKFMLDGVLAGSGSGTGAFNANTLFVNTSLTYNF
jgi:hypothetical protein